MTTYKADLFLGGKRVLTYERGNVVDAVTPNEGESHWEYCGRTGESSEARPDVPLSWVWSADPQNYGEVGWHPPVTKGRSCDRSKGTCPIHARGCPAACDWWAVSDAVTDRRRSVTPEVGQVWDPQGQVARELTEGGLLVVKSVSPDGIVFFRTIACARLETLARMRLVGFELPFPDGRQVNVGDRFENLTRVLGPGGWRIWAGTFEVAEVLPGACVGLVEEGKEVGPHLKVDVLLDPKFGWVRCGGVDAAKGEERPRSVTTGGYPDRSEVDALLREDARRHPEFARARAAAVLAYADRIEVAADARREAGLASAMSSEWTEAVLAACHEYEGVRGGGRVPAGRAADYKRRHFGKVLFDVLETYERARAL